MMRRPKSFGSLKAKDLNERKLIFGCDCGCRGDWSLDDAGLYERPALDSLLGKAT